MPRARHPNKEIEAALQYAEAKGWKVTKAGKSGHAWGRMQCPKNSGCRDRKYCQRSIWSTPRSPENHAHLIRRAVDGCHDDED